MLTRVGVKSYFFAKENVQTHGYGTEVKRYVGRFV